MRATTVGQRVIHYLGSFLLPQTNQVRTHRLFFLPSFLPEVIFLVFASHASANPNDDPSKLWVFGADAPVAFSHDYSQQVPAISGNTVVWIDQRPNAQNYNSIRVLYRRIPEATAPPDSQTPPEQELVAGSFGQSNPAISGNLVVWQELIDQGVGYQIHYKYIDSPGSDLVSNTSTTQKFPKVSGTRIVWQDERRGSRQSQVFMKDLSNGQEMLVADLPGDNIEPAIDGDWVVWVHNDLYGYTTPAINDIFAKNIVTGELRQLTTANDNRQQELPAISGANIVWSDNFRSGGSLSAYDLSTGQTRIIPDSQFASYSAIEGNIISWNQFQTHQIHMIDLSTGISQQVSRDTQSSGGTNKKPDAVGRAAVSSGHIVWRDDRDMIPTIYQNKLKDRAQELADRYRPELRFTLGENFEPMPVEQFLSAPGTFLMKKNDATFDRIRNPSIHDLATNGTSADFYLDLLGESITAGGGNPSDSIDHGYVYNYFVKPYQSRRDQSGNQFPRVMYARVVSRPEGDEKSFIQYWLFYYANDHAEIFHEGDWEVVQVELDKELKPIKVDYSQHGYGQWRNWDGPGSVEKSQALPNQPVVYVGMGSHANYFSANAQHAIYYNGINLWYFKIWDDASGNGNNLNNPQAVSPSFTNVKVLPEKDQVIGGEFEWINYDGQWGEYTNADVGVDACWTCIPQHGIYR